MGEESTVVLKSLLTAQQQLTLCEEKRAGSSRRWVALQSELLGLRAEEGRQRTRVQSLRRQHTDSVREIEACIVELKNKMKAISGKATTASRESPQWEDDPAQPDIGGQCAALLLNELERLQASKLTLEAQLESATAKTVQARAQ